MAHTREGRASTNFLLKKWDFLIILSAVVYSYSKSCHCFEIVTSVRKEAQRLTLGAYESTDVPP